LEENIGSAGLHLDDAEWSTLERDLKK